MLLLWRRPLCVAALIVCCPSYGGPSCWSLVTPPAAHFLRGNLEQLEPLLGQLLLVRHCTFLPTPDPSEHAKLLLSLPVFVWTAGFCEGLIGLVVTGAVGWLIFQLLALQLS